MGSGSRAGAWRATLCSAWAAAVVLTHSSIMSASLLVGGRVLLLLLLLPPLLARARRFTYSARSSRTREAFLGCTSHAADLQHRADLGEDYRIFGGVVTDEWVDAVQASSSLGLCDCVLASSGI
jgi:hypothetical protein